MYQTEIDAVQKIKAFFTENKKEFVYMNQKKTEHTCKMIGDGIEVTSLGSDYHQNFLPWGVFFQAVHILLQNDGIAIKGEANSQAKLGSEELPFNSVEGHIAASVYGKAKGDSVFRRISPITYILIASGICIDKRGSMELAPLSN